MTWKKMLVLMAVLMLAMLLSVYFIISRQRIPLSDRTVLGVRSLFPAGSCALARDAENGWQGFVFARGFRFFSRPSVRAQQDFRELVQNNLSRLPLRVSLSLYSGGVYALQKAGKGYRLFCIFYRDGTNYWADMVSRDSMDSSCRAFERFILHLEIAGEKPSPAVAGQVASLHTILPLLFMQTHGQLLGMMAALFVLALLSAYLTNRFSGSCPRRDVPETGACTPYATLRVGGFGRRRLSACCLRHEGGQLVIYRFRRPYMKIDIAGARHEIVWETTSFRYKNIRVILPYADFQNWRTILMV